jgi:hypothetical protein
MRESNRSTIALPVGSTKDALTTILREGAQPRRAGANSGHRCRSERVD